MTPFLLVAHGSADARATATIRALACAVAEARPGVEVRAAFLDHAGPRVAEALVILQAAGHPRVRVVPLLLTAAYHGRVDLPSEIQTARQRGLTVPVTLAGVLGPGGSPGGSGRSSRDVPALLVEGLRRRLSDALAVDAHPQVGPLFDGSGEAPDAVVLAAAGSRDARARLEVELVAERLGSQCAVPCRVAYASAASPTVSEAVEALRGGGARRIAVAAYFLACGRLYDAAAAAARMVGAVAVAAPLGTSAEVVELVLARVDAA